MKEVIMNVLEDCSQGQINLKSKAAREVIANLIMDGIESNGWYLNLGEKELNSGELDTAGYPIKKISKYLTANIDKVQMIDNDVCKHNNDINSTCSECDEQQARESWVCEYCNKSTYDVEWDYIGSGTNHLGCELKEEMKEKFIEESNKNPVPKQHERIRREKNWLQKKHEDKVFDKDDHHDT